MPASFFKTDSSFSLTLQGSWIVEILCLKARMAEVKYSILRLFSTSDWLCRDFSVTLPWIVVPPWAVTHVKCHPSIKRMWCTITKWLNWQWIKTGLSHFIFDIQQVSEVFPFFKHCQWTLLQMEPTSFHLASQVTLHEATRKTCDYISLQEIESFFKHKFTII